jgi:predicted glycosyltransferase involved in capsule biosynthesis
MLGVKLIHCSSEGQFAKANIAIASAESEWIVITHDDDILLENTYELLKIANESECSLVIANAVSFGNYSEDWNERHSKVFDFFFYTPHSRFLDEVFIHGNPIAFPGVLLNSRKVKAAGGFNENFICYGDFELWLRLSKISEFLYVNLINLRYRLHENQQSSKSSLVRRLEMSCIRSQYLRKGFNRERNSFEKLKNLFAVVLLLISGQFVSLGRLAKLINKMRKE